MALRMQFFGSFHRGSRIHSDNALSECWRQIERIATVESLERLAASKGRSVEVAKLASIRLRQGIELRRASQGASIQTRPLLLYYSALNLMRGIMLGYPGDMGAPLHGLRFVAAKELLDCRAKVNAKGTFSSFLKSLNWPEDEFKGKEFTLRELLLMIPETYQDHGCISKFSATAVVEVTAYMDGETLLNIVVSSLTPDEFAQTWQTMFPWFSELCVATDQDFVLRVKNKLLTTEAVETFCEQHLWRDLRFRQETIWYDHVCTRASGNLDRRAVYLAALFILSNVTRYEPELLSNAQDTANELGFFINGFLDAAERFFPQLVLELDTGPVYFV